MFAHQAVRTLATAILDQSIQYCPAARQDLHLLVRFIDFPRNGGIGPLLPAWKDFDQFRHFWELVLHATISRFPARVALFQVEDSGLRDGPTLAFDPRIEDEEFDSGIW